MKISSVSKKVLASALSAAMVVAFAPTVAFGANSTGGVTGTYTTQSGAVATATYPDIETAILAAQNKTADGNHSLLPPTATTITNTGDVIAYNYNYAPGISTITLQEDIIVTDDIVLTAAAAGITIDLNGNSITAAETNQINNALIDVQGGNLKIVGDGEIVTKIAKPAIKNAAVLTIAGGKVVAEGDAANVVAIDGNATVAGGEVSATAKDNKNDSTAVSAKAVNGTLTMTAGKVSAVNKDVEASTGGANAIAANAAAKISGGEISAKVTEKGSKGYAYGILGNVSALTADAAISAENSSDVAGMKAIGIAGSVTKDVAGKVTAKANNGDAYGVGDATTDTIGGSVTGTVSAESTKGSAVAIYAAATSAAKTDSVNATVSAKALNDDQSATVFAAAVTPEVKGGTYTATAGEDTTTAPANLATIFGSTVAKVSGGTFTAVGGSDTNTKLFAAAPTSVNGGTFVGEIGAAGQYIQGGTWIAKPKAFMNTAVYGYVDDNETYTVYTKYKTLSEASKTELGKVVTTASAAEDILSVQDAATDVFDAICQDGATSVKGLVFVGDATIQTIKDHLLSGDIELAVKTKEYKKALATDAQKAVQDAFDAFAKDKNSVANSYTDFKVVLQYTPKGATEAVELAYITDLGTGERGKARTITLKGVDGKGNIANQYYTQYIDGSVVKAELNAKDGSVATGTIAPYAVLTVSGTAINDDVKPADPETPVAPEKATQSISVEKKSMAVKLGAKKTKTAKGKSFSMGALAETDLTIAKVSGSSKITVSGDKVKLAKGVKRGTYKATVSLKAAATDAYLADATTITVKFVIK